MTALTIRLLGPFQIWRGDELITPKMWPTRKTCKLCQVLMAKRGHVVAKDRLFEWLWPHLTPASAGNSLRVSISQLRRLLEPELLRGADSAYVITQSDGYFFRASSDCWIDVDAFLEVKKRGQKAERIFAWTSAIEAYRAAATLYRGDYLEEDIYSEWAISERAVLRERYLFVLERLSACYAQQGNYAKALEMSQRLAAVEPLRESAYRQMMLYHYYLGQRNQAMQAFEQCEQKLAEELNVSPEPATLQLAENILHGEVRKKDQVVSFFPESQLSSERRHDWPPFLARQKEMRALAGCLQDVMAGRGRVALIVGEAGAGKTRLIEEFLISNLNDISLFRGQAFELEHGISFQPVREAVEHWLLNHPSPPRKMLGLLGPLGAQMILLIPELRSLFSDIDLEHEQVDPAHLLNALTGFFLALAEHRPVVLFLDDLQFADSSTWRFLHFLGRRIGHAPIFIIGAAQYEALTPNHPFWTLKDQLQQKGLLLQISLDRLPFDVVDRLVAQRADPEWNYAAFSRRLYEETEGNPLYLTEILRNMTETGWLEERYGHWRLNPHLAPAADSLSLPASIRQAIEARYYSLGEDCQQVLRLAAVVGRSFTLDLMQRACGLPPEALVNALDELTFRHLLKETTRNDEPSYDVSHGKIREVIYECIGPSWRMYLHRSIARALESRYAGRTEVVAGWLAYHYEAAGDEDKAVTYLLLAGDQARRMYAYEKSVQHYTRALALLEKQSDQEATARTLLKLGLVYQIGCDYKRARRAYDEGFMLWRGMATAAEVDASTMPTELHVARSENLDTLEPNMAWDSISISVVEQLFSGLAQHTPEMEVVPNVARRWKVSADGKRYTIFLRRDVYWSNGDPVTALDFEYALQRLLSPNCSSPATGLLYDIRGASSFHAGVIGWEDVGVTAPSPYTLVIELNAPSAYFPHLLCHNAMLPVPRRVVESHGREWTKPGNIVTNGPFLLETYQPGVSVVLRANPLFHGRFTGNCQRVIFSFQGEVEDYLKRYRQNDIDILRLSCPFSPEAMRGLRAYGSDYVSIPTLYTMFLGCNVRHPLLADANVRRALFQTIDLDALVGAVLRGYASPAKEGLLPPGIPGHQEEVGVVYDPQRAMRQVARMGLSHGAFPALSLLGHQGEHWRTVGDFLLSAWRNQLGVVGQWVDVATGQFASSLNGEGPQLFLAGWYADYPDPDSFLRANPFLGFTGWRDSQFEALVEEARRVHNQKQRIELYRQAEHILLDSAAIMPLLYGREHWLVKPWVKKLPISPIKWWFWKDVVIGPH